MCVRNDKFDFLKQVLYFTRSIFVPSGAPYNFLRSWYLSPQFKQLTTKFGLPEWPSGVGAYLGIVSRFTVCLFADIFLDILIYDFLGFRKDPLIIIIISKCVVLNTFPLSRTPLPKALSRLKARPLSHSVAFSAFTHTSQSRCKRYVAVQLSGKLCFNVGILGTVEVIFHDPNVLLLAMITIIFSPVISVVWFAFHVK